MIYKLARSLTVNKRKRGDKMAKIILASHGELSKGMLNSVNMIVGDLASDVETFCLYPGQNPNDYAQILKERFQKDNEHYILVCDIKGGSVYNALVQTCIYGNVDVLSGMNMNLVLELVLANNSRNLELNQILNNAKCAITIQNKESLNQEIEEEDF